MRGAPKDVANAQADTFDALDVLSNVSTRTPSFASGAGVPQNAIERLPLSLDGFVAAGLVYPATALTAHGAHGRTTVMFRNLPERFTRPKLEQLLRAEGFGKLYDFIYLPAELASGSCFGYAFINMATPEDAERFVQHFQGFDRWPESDVKRAVVHLSEVLQGFHELVERYRNSALMHPSVFDELRPAVYRRGVRVAFPKPTATIRPPRKSTSSKHKVPPQKAAIERVRPEVAASSVWRRLQSMASTR